MLTKADRVKGADVLSAMEFLEISENSQTRRRAG